MTGVKLWVVTFDMENLHFDIDTCIETFGDDQRPEVARCYRSIKLMSHSIAKAPYGTCKYTTHRSAQQCLTEQESHCP